MKIITLPFACASLAALFAANLALAQSPTATILLPARNAHVVARNTNVAATLSQALPTGTVPALKVFSQQAGGQKAGATTVGGSTVTFNPTTDFKPGETVTASLSVSSATPAQVWQFTAAATGGTGTFGPGLAATNAGTGNIEIGDIDNDGDLDVLSVGTQTVTVYRNSGTGQLVASGSVSASNVAAIRIADVDGDGDLDLLATNVDITTIRYRVTLFRNDGTGTFTQSTSTDIGNTAQFLSRIAVADVDADGDLDMLYSLTSANNQLVVHLNNGTGTFNSPLAPVVVASTARTVQHMLADVDNDGDLDAIGITNDVSGGPQVYFNNGAGLFSAPVSYQASNYSGGMVLGDIDNDGDLDIAVPEFTSNSVIRLLLNNGNGVFTAGPLVPAGNAASTLALGDLNGDGSLDMIVAGNQISVLLNSGNATFTPNPTVTLANAQHDGLALVDMDGDGDLDITTKAGGIIYVSLNQGTVASTKPEAATALQVWPNPAAASTALHLQLAAPTTAARAILHTVLGQAVREHSFSGSTTDVPLTGLSRGVYLLAVHPDQQPPITRRVVIE